MKPLYLIFILFFFSGMLSAQDTISVYCDDELLPFLNSAAAVRMRSHPDTRLRVGKISGESDTGSGIRIAAFDDESADKETNTEFCATAIFFAVSNDAPISNISSEQAKKILDGTMTHWRDNKNRRIPIRIYLTKDDKAPEVPDFESHSHEDEADKEGQNEEKKVPPKQLKFVIGGKAKTIASLAADPDGLAFLDITDFNRKEVKLLSVDGVAPTIENVLSGKYPFSKKFYLTGEKNVFSEYLCGLESARLMLRHGILPLTQKNLIQESQ